MVLSHVLGTNVALYHLGGRLVTPLKEGGYCLSVITELELLFYPEMAAGEEQLVRAFLSELTVVGLNADIRESTIRLRRTHRLKLPDAIICATAYALNATLLTNDTRLAAVSDIQAQSVEIRSVGRD